MCIYGHPYFTHRGFSGAAWNVFLLYAAGGRMPVRTVLRKVMEPEFLVSCYQNTPVYFSLTAFLHPPPFLSLDLLGQVRDQMDLMCSPCTAKPRALRQWLLLCALSLSSRRTPTLYLPITAGLLSKQQIIDLCWLFFICFET